MNERLRRLGQGRTRKRSDRAGLPSYSARLASRGQPGCQRPAPTTVRISSSRSISNVRRIAPRHSARRSQWKSSCVGTSNSALSLIGIAPRPRLQTRLVGLLRGAFPPLRITQFYGHDRRKPTVDQNAQASPVGCKNEPTRCWRPANLWLMTRVGIRAYSADYEQGASGRGPSDGHQSRETVDDQDGGHAAGRREIV